MMMMMIRSTNRWTKGVVRRTSSEIKRRTLATTTTTSSEDPLKATDDFYRRHVGLSDTDVSAMLSSLGFSSLEELSLSTVPEQIRTKKGGLKLPPSMSESEALREIKRIASKNKVMKSAIGMGYYGTETPAVILRNMVENPGWYTAYTPYQAELSQGRMEMLLNFQTMVADLTAMRVSGASLLDEATAAAEAMSMSHRILKGKRNKFFLDEKCHPQTIDVIRTRAEPIGIEIVVGDVKNADFSDKEYCGVLVQYPNTEGSILDYANVASAAKKAGTLVTAATDLMALTLIKPPGEWGADICVGSAQRFGVPMFFGGPHAAFLAVNNEKHLRQMPGRVIGVSKDMQGRPALRMALATREQHIRRDKATSNICTAQALLANVAASYGVYHGPNGLRAIAKRIRAVADAVSEGVSRAPGCNVQSSTRFDTIVVDVDDAKRVVDAAVDRGINVRFMHDKAVGVSVDETYTREDVRALVEAFGGTHDEQDGRSVSSLGDFERTSDFMTHPVFNTHHSETHMLRYLRSLEVKDIALNHSMIPLGSCTMKLNATSEMIPVTWPEFSNIHPFAPANQREGYDELIGTLSDWLSEITGFAAVSNQPNSGASGEYAGLLAIRNYLKSRDGSNDRNVCLIPASAHGTNPASAVMAGMKVVVVKNLENGEIDMVDFQKKADKHADKLAACMVTYPSTYGVFEEGVKDLIDMVHERGGQVYMDGANMNAQVVRIILSLFIFAARVHDDDTAPCVTGIVLSR